MRLECGVGFRQLRTCRRTRPGQLCAMWTNPLPRERAARGAGASGTDGV